MQLFKYIVKQRGQSFSKDNDDGERVKGIIVRNKTRVFKGF